MSGALNATTVVETVRKPRLRLLANGTEIPGIISASVTNNNWFHADTFEADIALDAGPYDAAFWGQDGTILIDVAFGFDYGDSIGFRSFILGEIDSLDLDLPQGTIRIAGRDLSRRFIDNKTQKTFANQTSSEVIQSLVSEFGQGMTADVTATTEIVGRYYQTDHDYITLGQFHRAISAWDLMVYLARIEQFDLYVSGTTVHFHPKATETDPSYTVQWTPRDPSIPQSNVIDLRLERSLTLARDVIVEVRSWNSRQKRAITKTAERRAGSTSASAADTQRYVFVRPNMTPDAAQQLANQLLNEITQHERVVTFRVPGDLDLTARQLIRVSGTGSSWDTPVYRCDSVTRHLSFESGFEMDVRAKNHTTDAEAEGTIA